MKNLCLILLSSSVAFACVAPRTFALVTWSNDCPTSFELTICGTGPTGGGKFTSPSGQWEFDDSFNVTNFPTSLQLQQCGGSVEFAPSGGKDDLPGCFGFGYANGNNYECGTTSSSPENTLPGWSIGSFITYDVVNPHNPDTWQWTIECHGSGPDLVESGCKTDWPCCENMIPEPGSLSLVGVGLCGLGFLHRRRIGRRARKN